jgi:hypothetical protein
MHHLICFQTPAINHFLPSAGRGKSKERGKEKKKEGNHYPP